MRYRPAIERPPFQVLWEKCKRFRFLASGRTHAAEPCRVDTSSITKPMPVHHGCDWQVEDTDPVQGWPLSESPKKQLSLSKTNVSVTKSTRLRQAKRRPSWVQNFSGNFFPFFWGIFFHFKLSVLLKVFSVKIVGRASRETILLDVFSVKIVGSIARNDPFGCFFRENCRNSFARNDHFGTFFCENCRKLRTKRSFWKLFLWNFEAASHETIILEPSSVKIVGEASHETIILEPSSVKIVGSFARNARFGSFFCEILKQPRTKRSFWNLLLWKLSEASHETLVLEAFSVKFGGSLARNDHFGTFFCENCRKLRTKRSFWKLFFCEIWRPLARNDHFGSFFCTGVVLE